MPPYVRLVGDLPPPPPPLLLHLWNSLVSMERESKRIFSHRRRLLFLKQEKDTKAGEMIEKIEKKKKKKKAIQEEKR